MISAVLLFTVFLTSLLSGIFGMAGGMILMGVLALLLTVESAMIFHGIAQFTANGYRAFNLKEHIKYGHILKYLLGSVLAVALFASFSYIPSKRIVFFIMGLVPFLTFIPFFPKLDFQQKGMATLCGFLVSLVQLTCGVSGSILDIFFLKTKMNRYEIIATKAFTQAFAHAIKFSYYVYISKNLSEGFDMPSWLYFVVLPASILGTLAGAQILKKMSDAQFLKYTRYIVAGIGFVYLYKAWVS